MKISYTANVNVFSQFLGNFSYAWKNYENKEK